MKKIISFSLISFLVLLNTNCTNGLNKKNSDDLTIVIKSTPGKPLAEVGETILTLEELSDDFLARQGTFKGAPHLNTEKKRVDYVESEVLQQAMFLEAIELGLLNDPEVKRNVKKIVVQKLMRDQLEKAQSNYVATEEEMQKHYDENQNLYNRNEALKVAYYAIPFGSNKNEAGKLAANLQKDAKENVQNANAKQFARLAMKHAKEAVEKYKVAIETNESPYLEKEDFERKFGPTTFAAINQLPNTGDLSQVLTTDTHYYVLMKTGYRKALNESFADAKPKIQKRLAYENRGKVYENYVASLKNKYNIKIHHSLVADLGKEGLKNINQNEPANALANNPSLIKPTENVASHEDHDH